MTLAHFRIARPVTDLERSVRMYAQGLQFQVLGRFADHEGFDGVMLGYPDTAFHFEFTCRPGKAVIPSPTFEDLLVVYLPDRRQWAETCLRMLEAGFVGTTALNPYWNRRGRTFVDPDRYQVVIEQDQWPG